MRWLIALGLVVFVAPVQAGVFKGRDNKKPAPATKTDAKTDGKADAKTDAKDSKAPAKDTTTTAKKPAPAPAATAKKPAPAAKTPVAKKAAPAKKGSKVATKGRPDDLTPDVKKGKDADEDEEDVIVRDLDD